MKWDVAAEYAYLFSSISVIGSKFFVHVCFLVCLVLVRFGVMGSMLLCEVVGYAFLQFL